MSKITKIEKKMLEEISGFYEDKKKALEFLFGKRLVNHDIDLENIDGTRMPLKRFYKENKKDYEKRIEEGLPHKMFYLEGYFGRQSVLDPLDEIGYETVRLYDELPDDYNPFYDY